MDYPGQYKIQLLQAIQRVDLDKVCQIIQIFKAARAHGHRIFVCGNGGADSMAAQFLCELVKSPSFNRSSRFRILALSDQRPRIDAARDDFANERVFVEQLRNFAEPEDVVMGLSPSGDSPNVANAIEYASWIGCRTIGITGQEGGRVAALAQVIIEAPVSHPGAVEDVHMIICHMIGYYFVDFEKPAGQGREKAPCRS